MRLTPDQFAKQLPSWYWKWRKANPAYFPLEERLSRKGKSVGHLNMEDLVAITHVLGNPFNIRGKVQTANTDAEVKAKTREAIQHLSEPASAIRSMLAYKAMGTNVCNQNLEMRLSTGLCSAGQFADRGNKSELLIIDE